MNSLTLPSPLPLDQNPAAVYIASLGTDAGRRSQTQALRVIAEILGGDVNTIDWSALRFQHTTAIRSKLAETYRPATANKFLSALRKTLEKAFLLGQMSADDYQRAIKVGPVTGKTEPAGRYITPDEIKAILDACKNDENYQAGARDAAMIALMYIALVRREALANLTLANYNPRTGALLITDKRSKERTNFITNGAKDALDRWISIRGDEPGALFVAIDKTGRIAGYDHFSPQAVYNMTVKRSNQAGVENNSPHNFRRTGASDYLELTDALVVADLGGWESLQTLKRYDRRPEEAKKRAATKLQVPY